LASVITAPHPLEPPHGIDSPVGRAAALGGCVLLLGAGHSANTTIHVAESLAHVPYGVRRHYTVVRDGVAVRVEYDETDHCCERFARLDDWLRARNLQSERTVGHGPARLMRGADILRIAVAELAADPFAFLHPRQAGCAECDAAWASVRESSEKGS
jgi:aminoglycoside N3'-acetyltransferase